MINDVIGANTGMHVPWFAFPLLFRSGFGKMFLANALAGPTELRALEAHEWRSDDFARVSAPVHLLVGSTSPPFNRQFADFVAAHVPGAHVEVVEGGNHGTPLDDPSRFAAVIERLR